MDEPIGVPGDETSADKTTRDDEVWGTIRSVDGTIVYDVIAAPEWYQWPD